MVKIDTSNCKDGCSASFVQDVIAQNSTFDGVIYIYDNDLVDEGCEPYSITQFKPGDRVCLRSLPRYAGKVWTIAKISPATYGFMNVLIEDEDGGKTMSYSGDLARA